jgi:hypothetical protein
VLRVYKVSSSVEEHHGLCKIANHLVVLFELYRHELEKEKKLTG